MISKNSFFYSIGLFLVLLLTYNVVNCQDKIKQKQINAWENLNNNHENKWNILWNNETGSPSTIYGHQTKSYSGEPVDIAKGFLKENKDLFNMKENLSDLVLDKVVDNDGIKHISFLQQYNGIPIFTSGYSVHVSKNNCIIMANGRYFTDIDIDVIPKTSESQVIEIVLKNLETNSKAEILEKGLTIYPLDGDYLLTWRILVKEDFNKVWEYFIFADNNKIFKVNNNIIASTGQANVYMIDPQNSSLSRNVTLNRMTFNTQYLLGDYVNVQVDVGTRVQNALRDFRYEPTSDSFDQPNLYYHVDRIGNYFGYTRGYNIGQIIAYRIAGIGAYYSPYDGHISFGIGDISGEVLPKTRSTLLKDDCIYHEYTHAVTYIVGQRYSTDEAYARFEGYSDYFACTITGDPIYGEWVLVDYPHARTLSTSTSTFNYKNWNDLHYYDDINSVVYRRSMVWSGALWDLRSSLGATIADKIIFEGLKLSNGNNDFETAKAGIIQADIDFYSGQHQTTINTIFQNRGIGKPYTPANFTLSGSVGGHPTLSWTANTEPDINGYKLYFSSDGTNYSLLATVNKYTTSYTDNGVVIGNGLTDPTVYYKVSAYDIHSNESDKSIARSTKASGINKESVATELENKLSFKLYPAYPNPFNPETKIKFELSEKSKVTIEIFDILGNKVDDLVNDNLNPGLHERTFIGVNLASGIYVYRINAMGIESGYIFNDIKKIVLTK